MAKMGNAAGQDKDVPGSVEISQPVEGKEDDAERVSQAAGAHPRDAMPADGLDQRTNGKDGKPTLEEVDERRSHFKTPHGETLEDDAGNGQRPLDAEDGPAQRTAQGDQGEGV